MIKKLHYVILAAGALGLSAHASVVSPQEAYNAALRQGNSGSLISRAPSIKSAVPMLTLKAAGEATVYLFSDDNGCIVASAESETPALLGYTDKPVASVDEMPDGMRYWMEYYSNEIQQLRDGKVLKRAAASYNYAPVEPYVTTQWNQASPYYNMCPMLYNQRCVTGCVATAMAQAMKYYNWPAQGQGSISYKWTNGGQTLSTDFSQSVYEWDQMPNNFYGETTKTQERAVALLNMDCGYAVQMNYSPSASGAYDQNIPLALYTYFNYDKSMRYEQRDNFYTEDWIALVYEDVAAKRPVVYCGQGEAGGHCFICDGYSSDGYFHFNWGWGGTSDGYFKLSALAPGIQGIGGNNGNFNSMQSIVFGLQKPSAVSKLGVVLSSDGAMEAGADTYTSGSVKLGISDGIINYSVEPVTGSFGAKLIPVGGGDPIYVQGSDQATLSTINGSNPSASGFRVPFANFPTSGSYAVEPAFYMNGEWYDVEISRTYPYALECDIADGVITFNQVAAAAQLDVSNFEVTSGLYSGLPFEVTFDASNPGTEQYYGDMRLALLSSGTTSMVSYTSVFTVDVNAGATDTQDVVTEFVTKVSPGTYNLALISGYGFIYANQSVTISAAPTESTEVTLSNLTVSNATGTGTDSAGFTTYTVDPSNIQVSGTVTCTQGYLADAIEAYVFPPGGGTALTSLGSSFHFLSAGNSATLSINGSFPNAQDNAEYLIGFFNGSKQVSGAYLYIVTDKSSGVKAIEATDLKYTIDGDNLFLGGIEGNPLTRIYSVDGTLVKEAYGTSIDISSLRNGVYLVVVKEGNNVLTAKIVR